MKSAKVKAGNYCAYQERTHQEVRDKLYELGLYRDEVEEVLTELISENYVNEERFARTFASGKFRLKHWGRRKIIYELKHKNISPYCIDKALKEISDEEYEKVAMQLVDKKLSNMSGEEFIVKNKIARYMSNKGFETELVWSILNNNLKFRH
ncbi:MAG: RecX family transcriptional regulator [Cyclobacteriaceae bacterium]|nr:RecX family transcriptional regulator [Cyclobacteriaceae bacterium]MCK5280307.1 RecX family transcriptional regulator [Cyclobacteriaceae bacterium]MCK5367561.1 RecX family transcriptional regulator [Cyclobacteriaceae bacterium]